MDRLVEQLNLTHLLCYNLFSILVDSSQTPAHEALGHQAKTEISEAFDKYKLWIGNLGVTPGRHLDMAWLRYRLRNLRFLNDQVSMRSRATRFDLTVIWQAAC
jgi:hypothetical protein